MKKGAIDEMMTLEEIKQRTIIKELDAYPDPGKNNLTDVWVLVPKGKKPKKTKQTPNPYNVRHGVVNDLNSVFFVNILGKNNGDLKIENKQIGKKKVKQVKTVIENDLIYPIVKPRHVKRWNIKGYYYIIIPHKKHGQNNESELRVNYEKTYDYLFKFKKDLLKRSSRWFKGGGKPFYTFFGIGDYTFKPFKVVWSSIGYLHAFAVASKVNDRYIGKKVIIPDNTISYISFDSEDEAYFVCGILNTTNAEKIFSHRSTKSKWGISIGMVKNLQIPQYNSKNKIHKKIVELSKKAHGYATNDDISNIEKIENNLNQIIAQNKILRALNNPLVFGFYCFLS
jgi:hypothetical protein